MRVLHFAHSFIPQYGGTTTRLINLLSDERDTHYLYVPLPATPRADGTPVPLEEDFENIKVRRCRLLPVPSISIFAKLNASRLMRSVTDNDIDVVQGHNPPTSAWAALRSAQRRRLPFIYEAHRLSFDSYGANKKGDLPGPVDSAIRRFIRREEGVFFTAADQIIVQTTMHRDRILEVFPLDPERIHVIPMGVDEDEFAPTAWGQQGRALRGQRGWGDKVVFMYNGYLGDTNGVEALLRAALDLPASVKDRIKIVVLGRGPLKPLVEELRRRDPSLIEDLGLVDYRRMPAYYSAVDVVAIPLAPILLWECNNPTKLLEAMAMEKVVLASDVHGITEIMENGQTGITYRKGDGADLVRQIVHIVDNIGQMDELRRRARVTVVKTRSWRTCREQLQGVYRSIQR